MYEWRDDNIRELIDKIYTVELAELIADMQILRFCVNGVSNVEIAFYTQVDLNVVEYVIKHRLDFPGFEFSLSVSPWLSYRNGLTISEECDTICKKYENYKRKVDEYYEKC